MTERATVEKIEDIKVGDRVWVCQDMHRNKRDWSLQTVTKIARVYFTTTTGGEWPTGYEFARETGGGRSERGFSPGRRAFGEADKFIFEHRYSINRMVENCRDVGTLLKIAQVLGIKTPEPLEIK